MFVPAARAADVEITSDRTTGLDLDGFTGATARIGTGVTVSNTNVAQPAVSATTQFWTLTNDGTIGPTVFGDGVKLELGGTVVNSGSIDGFNGIWLGQGPGTVNNLAGGTIHGDAGAIVCGFLGSCAGAISVTNAGDMTSDSADAIVGNAGGTVTNLAGALIQSDGSNAISILFGTTREVTNSGTIRTTNSGSAGISIDGAMVTNNTGGEIVGTFNGIWAHTAGGATTVINHGLIEATEAAFNFGVPGSAIELDAGGSVTNTGTIRSSSTNATDAAIYSNRATSIINSGMIQSLTGGLAIQFDNNAVNTLTLDTGSVLGGNVQGGSSTDNLVLKGTGTESAAKFLSFQTLDMQGTDWTLTGTGTFSTSGTVTSGRLAVNGALTTGALSVLSGGILGGGGTVNGAVTNAGTIAPGNSIGTLTVASVLFSPNSLFSVEIDPSVADELVVTGTGPGAATIGSNVQVLVSPASGTYTSGMSYPILASGSAISGTFAGVIDTSAFLDFALDYVHTPNQVWLTITTVADFAAIGQTPNQKAAAGGAQALGPGNSVYDALLPLDAPTARTAFDLLSGEIHASTKGALLDQSRFVREAILGRLGEAFGSALFELAPLAYAASREPTTAPPWPGARAAGRAGAWAEVFGSGAALSGDGNAAGLDRQVGGFVAGGDWTGDNGFRFGAATGIDVASLSEPARSSTASVGSYHLALYGGFEGGAIKARAGAAVAWQDISTRREAAFPGFADTLTASYGARTAQVFGEVAKPFRVGSTTIEPFAGAAWVGVEVDGFSEQGGAAALSAPAGHAATALTNLGLRVDRPLDLGGVPARVTGAIAWQHALGGLTPTANMAFSGGAPFTIAGTPRAADVLKLDLGLSASLGPQATGELGYSGEIGSGVQDHALLGRLTVSF